MASPIFDRDRAARIIAEAIAGGDEATAAKHGISLRTIQRWRARLDGDSQLAQAVAEKKAIVERDWAEHLPGAIGKAIEFLGRAADSSNTNDPDMVHSVAGALKILTDVAMSRRIVDARISRQAGQPREADREGAAGRPNNVVALPAR